MGTNKGARSSKFLALILRHQPSAAGITLDSEGWADVPSLIQGMITAGTPMTLDELRQIVAEDNKGRYVFNADQSKIRAAQGHSVNVDLGLKEIQPPDILYHGTAMRFRDAILSEGIKKMSRQHVHLSDTVGTAINVGSRHGSPLVLTVEAKLMYTDGIKFYQSENGIWLTDDIAPKYIRGS